MYPCEIILFTSNKLLKDSHASIKLFASYNCDGS